MPKKVTKAGQVSEDIEKYAALEALSLTEGGKLLIQTQAEQILDDLTSMTTLYQTATHAELVSRIARIEACMATIGALTNARANKSYARKYLEELLIKEPDDVIE